MFCDTSDAYASFRVISQVQVGVLTVRKEQVANDLVIDLHVRHLQANVLISLLLNRLEEILQDKHHDSWRFQSTRHRVSFTRACCAICKHAGVVTFDNGWNQLIAGATIDILSADFRVEDPVKEVALLSRPMQDIWLLVLLLVFDVNAIEDDDEFVLRLNDFKIFLLNLLGGHWTNSDGDDHV